MERHEKRTIVALKAELAKATSLVLAELPRPHRQGRHQPAPRVPGQRLPVPGREEHPARPGGQGDAHGGARATAGRARPPSPTRSRIRRPPPRWRPRSRRQKRSSSSRAATSMARRWTVKGVEALSHLPGQGRAACDFPCNFARRAAELPAAAQRRPAELRLSAGRARASARGRVGRGGSRGVGGAEQAADASACR